MSKTPRSEPTERLTTRVAFSLNSSTTQCIGRKRQYGTDGVMESGSGGINRSGERPRQQLLTSSSSPTPPASNQPRHRRQSHRHRLWFSSPSCCNRCAFQLPPPNHHRPFRRRRCCYPQLSTRPCTTPSVWRVRAPWHHPPHWTSRRYSSQHCGGRRALRISWRSTLPVTAAVCGPCSTTSSTRGATFS